MLHRSDDRTTLEWHPITRDDIADLDVLLDAIEAVDEPNEPHTCAELYETFDDPEADPVHDTLLGRDETGTLVAFGWNRPYLSDVDPRRVHLQGGVHPDRRRQGIGHVVLQWQLDEAEQWHARTRTGGSATLRLIAYVDQQRTGQRVLYAGLGLEPVRWFADMSLSFAATLPEHHEPDGIRIVPLSRKRFESVRIAHNEAFADHLGARSVDVRGWEEQLLRPESRLSWSWVALAAETSEVVGYAINSADDSSDDDGTSEGWTDRLGVRPGWRGRGVARALLTASMRSFADAGLGGAGLGVDSDDPKRDFELYEALGYRSSHTVVMYAKTVENAPEG